MMQEADESLEVMVEEDGWDAIAETSPAPSASPTLEPGIYLVNQTGPADDPFLNALSLPDGMTEGEEGFCPSQIAARLWAGMEGDTPRVKKVENALLELDLEKLGNPYVVKWPGTSTPEGIPIVTVIDGSNFRVLYDNEPAEQSISIYAHFNGAEITLEREVEEEGSVQSDEETIGVIVEHSDEETDREALLVRQPASRHTPSLGDKRKAAIYGDAFLPTRKDSVRFDGEPPSRFSKKQLFSDCFVYRMPSLLNDIKNNNDQEVFYNVFCPETFIGVVAIKRYENDTHRKRYSDFPIDGCARETVYAGVTEGEMRPDVISHNVEPPPTGPGLPWRGILQFAGLCAAAGFVIAGVSAFLTVGFPLVAATSFPLFCVNALVNGLLWGAICGVSSFALSTGLCCCTGTCCPERPADLTFAGTAMPRSKQVGCWEGVRRAVGCEPSLNHRPVY